MKRLTRILVTAVMLFTASVNAASPTESGFLSDYDRLIEGEYLEAYWVDLPALQQSASPDILLGAINVDNIEDHKGVTVRNCVEWLAHDLTAHRVISNNENARYRLDIAITYMDPGSSAARLLAGEFGAGHAQLQIEGKIVDTTDNKVVAAFAERRRSSGSLGAQDLTGNAGPHIIEHLVNLISADISSELVASFFKRQST